MELRSSAFHPHNSHIFARVRDAYYTIRRINLRRRAHFTSPVSVSGTAVSALSRRRRSRALAAAA
eukprot:6944762-Prymnesium_polylepis.2